MHHAELLLARPARALERRDDVCVGRGRDEAVADAARELRGVRLRCGDEDVDAAVRDVVDAGVVDGVVLAAVRLLAALPEEPEDADRFLEHLEALVRERPAAAEHVLVEVLAAADSEEEAAGIMQPTVAAACATIAGWMRIRGQVTPVPTRIVVVACAMPPSVDQTNGLCPCLSIHGW